MAEKYERRLEPAEKVKASLAKEARFLRSIGFGLIADNVETALDSLGEASLDRIGRDLELS